VRLRDRVRAVMRTRRYSFRTEKAYWSWIRSFIRYHGLRHPSEMGAPEVRAFLTWLAVHKNVAASTQNQALNALVFLYDKVLGKPLGDIGGAIRARRPPRLPVVLSHAEAMSIISLLDQPHRLAASLMYGSGLRVVECMRLRVQDLNVRRRVITVRDGKGGKDRTTLLPEALIGALEQRIASIRRSFASQRLRDRIPVTLPHALGRKYPHAAVSVAWQWVLMIAHMEPFHDRRNGATR
jgi:integrase